MRIHHERLASPPIADMQKSLNWTVSNRWVHGEPRHRSEVDEGVQRRSIENRYQGMKLSPRYISSQPLFAQADQAGLDQSLPYEEGPIQRRLVFLPLSSCGSLLG